MSKSFRERRAERLKKAMWHRYEAWHRKIGLRRDGVLLLHRLTKPKRPQLTLPQEFYDLVTAQMLVQPEPQWANLAAVFSPPEPSV